MKIKLIDFGLKADHHPFRPHDNDAGADVFMPYDCTLQPGEIARIPLGFGLIIPDGFAGYVFPRSSISFSNSISISGGRMSDKCPPLVRSAERALF